MRYVNAVIHTLGRNSTVAQALACTDGRLTIVGSARQVAAQHGDEVDLRGRVVLPGFVDAHGHLRALAQSLQSVDLAGSGSPQEAAARVARFAADRPEGSWIVGRGWDQTLWPSAAFPGSAVLDRAAPGYRAALTRIDGHALWVNTAALVEAGVDASTADPPGGRILRDATGNATGVLVDAAMAAVERLLPAPGDAEVLDSLAEAARRCSRFGLTSVHEMGVDQRGIDAFRTLVNQNRLPLRVRLAISGAGATWKTWRERGPERRYKDRLSVAAIKLFADGALGSRGATLLQPYADDPENTGLERASREDLERWTRDAVQSGFQVCTHAIGDRANRAVLDAYEAATSGAGSRDLRLRVEHAQVLDSADVPRFRALGVIPSMQPSHCVSDGPWARERLGEPRSAFAYAWRALLDTGVVIAGGSDFPVESPEPLRGIAAAVRRRPRGEGAAWHGEQRMTRAEAIRAFTVWAAYAGFDEEITGALEAGKYADFVVLDRDPYTCPEEELERIAVLMTVSGGEIAWSAPDAW